MSAILSIRELCKTYADGFKALKSITLDIDEGEILALLGPNGAGKTTLISTICGITTPTSGSVSVGGHDTLASYRAARAMIGSAMNHKSPQAAPARHPASGAPPRAP